MCGVGVTTYDHMSQGRATVTATTTTAETTTTTTTTHGGSFVGTRVNTLHNLLTPLNNLLTYESTLAVTSSMVAPAIQTAR